MKRSPVSLQGSLSSLPHADAAVPLDAMRCGLDGVAILPSNLISHLITEILTKTGSLGWTSIGFINVSCCSTGLCSHVSSSNGGRCGGSNTRGGGNHL